MRKIKPFIIIILLLIECNFAFSNYKKKKIEKLANNINYEIKVYIKSIKPQSIKNGQYDVYVVNMYYVDLNKRKVSLTIGSISNSYEFDDVYSDYVYYHDNEIILLRINTVMDSSILNVFNYKKFTQQDSINVMNKFIPINEGQITSDEECMSLMFYRNKIYRKKIPDTELLPNETIYKKSINYQMELR